MKQTKIVATVGPASESKDMLRQMVQAGMNVVRLNFSHGGYAWHSAVINRVREISHELKQPIAILADMQGPRIRTEVAREIAVKKGTRLCVSDLGKKDTLETGDQPLVLLDMAGVSDGLEKGHVILIEDGTIELYVVERHEDFVVAEAKNGGSIKNRKGVIMPDSHLALPILSKKDLDDLHFVLKEGVDYVGLSFVGSAEDVQSVRAEMQRVQGEQGPFPKLVSKIERKEAIKNLSAIVKASDAVMVARGDLGIEMPESVVVLLQKQIIAESLKAAKPVIVATQMMKSMVENSRPTRAEVSDVSNAVIDHTDAVMLSEESAMGKYPVETIRMMAEIVEKTEESPFADLYQALSLNFQSHQAAVIRSVYEVAKSFQAEAIVLYTETGTTARLLSHFRPESKILVVTGNRQTWQELALVWGIRPYLFDDVVAPEKAIAKLLAQAKEEGLVSAGDQIVVLHGRTPGQENAKLVGIQTIR